MENNRGFPNIIILSFVWVIGKYLLCIYDYGRTLSQLHRRNGLTTNPTCNSFTTPSIVNKPFNDSNE